MSADRHAVARGAARARSSIATWTSRPTRRSHARAGLLASGDAASAVSILRDAAQTEPDHWPLQVELGAALLATNDVAGADAIVRALPANVAEDAASRACCARVEFARAVAAALPRGGTRASRGGESRTIWRGATCPAARRVLDGDPRRDSSSFSKSCVANRAFL